MKILIADDDAVLNHLLDRHCRECGYETTLTFDAMQAWQHVISDRPDLILLDVKLPGGTGIEVLKRVHKTPNTARIPVIVITGVDDPLVLRVVQEQHPDAILSKPLNIIELDVEISRLLAGKQPNSATQQSGW